MRIKKLFLLNTIFIAMSLPVLAQADSLENRVRVLENLLQNNLNIESLNQVEVLQQEVQNLRGMLEEQEYQIKLLTKRQLDLQNKLGIENNAAVEEQYRFNDSNLNPDLKTNNTDENKNNQGIINKEEKNNGTIAEESAESIKNKNNNGYNVQNKDKLNNSGKNNSESASDNNLGLTGGDNYQKAYNYLQEKNYDMAAILFKDFIWQYPDSQLVANANYWLAEIYYFKWKQNKSNDGEFQQARAYFTKVIEDYKQHPKARDSLLKLAMLEGERGNLGVAKKYFESVKNLYPGTSAAKIAETKLEMLKQAGRL